MIATRNKAAELAVTLESIAVQDVPFPFEVIVVDDGSTDATSRVCRRFDVQYHRLNRARYGNPSTARNVGYRAARAEIIVAQSDEVVHNGPNVIEYLTNNLRLGEILLAQVDDWHYRDGKPIKFIQQFCGPVCQQPFFFLGTIWRKDLCAIGGCDEQFIEPCYDDNWFADCLLKGLGLSVRFTSNVKGRHQHHRHNSSRYGREEVSEKLYAAKVAEAERTGVWCSSGGPWQ